MGIRFFSFFYTYFDKLISLEQFYFQALLLSKPLDQLIKKKATAAELDCIKTRLENLRFLKVDGLSIVRFVKVVDKSQKSFHLFLCVTKSRSLLFHIHSSSSLVVCFGFMQLKILQYSRFDIRALDRVVEGSASVLVTGFFPSVCVSYRNQLDSRSTCSSTKFFNLIMLNF